MLHLLVISGFFSFALGSSDFHLIQLLKSYNEAKTYCREMYSDLATIHNSTDMSNLVTLISTMADRAWIGLETAGVRMWHWSWPDRELDFFNWRAGEPQNTDQDACAAMDNSGKWFQSDCGTKRSFVCHGNGDTSGHIFVAENKSWRDAQTHCRDLSSDLISIHSREENEAVRISQNLWIGLFKDPWKWSDGSNSSFRNWSPSWPNYLEGQDCTAAIFKNKGTWNDLRCVGKHFFICRGEKKSVLTNSNQTTTQENLTTPQQVSVNFTVVASTTKSNAANFTTEEQTTSDNLTTPNTTELVSSSSNNATTVMSTLTAIQIPPTTTVHTTNNGSALTTVMGTSTQTTPTPAPMPTENSQSLPGNLILIQENMTWIEAMGYCREHHIALVHITTRDIQEKVVKKIKHATSPHVWLGLRYTCEFKFWFWTSSATGCYQDWAPGQGSEGTYGCGVSGAIEATGRQQWVGLPETEKLNFICFACPG